MKPKQLVREIRRLLNAEEILADERTRQLAEEYAALCEQVNERLQRCEELLQRERWAEAEGLATAAPSLFELVPTLDFPERAEWEQTTEILGLPVPPPLLTGILEQLRDAAVRSQDLASLLVRHRALALARAPLKKRLATLRALAAADPGTTFWQDDLADMEAARLQELRGELKEAQQTGDAHALQSILEELTARPWLISEAQTLAAAVRKAMAEVRRQMADKQLPLVVDKLQEAYRARDLEAAQRLVQQWNRLSSEASAPAVAALEPQLRRALEWVDAELQQRREEEEYRRIVIQLEQLLDHPNPDPARLERLVASLSKFHRSLPAALSRRYHNYMDSLLVRRRRQQFARSALVAVFMAGLVAVGIYVAQRRAEARQAADTFRQIREALAQYELAEARRLLREHEPFLQDFEDWKAIRAELEELERAEQERAVKLADLITRLANARSRNEIDQLATQAKELARTSEERARVLRAQKESLDAVAQLEARKREEFQTLLERTLEALKNGEKAIEDRRTDSIPNLLQTAEKYIASLRSMAKALGSTAIGQADAAGSRLEALKNQFESMTREANLLGALGSDLPISAGDRQAREIIDKHLDAVQGFAREFPDSPPSADFRQLITYREVWHAAAAWAAIRLRWTPTVTFDSKDAAQRVKECDSFLKQPGCADVDQVKAARAFFASVARRFGFLPDDRNLWDEWDTFLSDLIFREAYVLETTDGRRLYYLPKPLDFGGAPSRRLDCYFDYNGLTRPVTIKREDLRETKSRRAPHVDLVQRFHARLRDRNPSDWDRWHNDFALELVKAVDIDPLLRAVLLRRVVDSARSGHAFLEKTLAPLHRSLGAEGIGTSVRWMRPDDEKIVSLRAAASRLMKSLPDDQIRSAWTEAGQQLGAFRQALGRDLRIVGVALKDAQGGWRLQPPPKTLANWIVLVCQPAKDGAARWERVGQCRSDGTVAWDDTASKHLRQGMLVFAAPAPSLNSRAAPAVSGRASR